MSNQIRKIKRNISEAGTGVRLRRYANTDPATTFRSNADRIRKHLDAIGRNDLPENHQPFARHVEAELRMGR